MKTKQRAITINEDFYLKFKKFCDKNGYAVAKVVALLMEDWLKDKEKSSGSKSN